MYYYTVYIGLAHIVPATQAAEKPRQHASGKARQTHSHIDIFCTQQQARDSTRIGPFLTYTRGIKHKQAGKRQRAKRAQGHDVSEWLQQFDYRFGRVQLEWWDMQAGEQGVVETGLACSAVYDAGILRLYRSQRVHADPECLNGQGVRPIGERSVSASTSGRLGSTSSDGKGTGNDENSERPRTLAVLAVPGYMTPTDFLSFTASFNDSIEHVRVVRDGSPSHYMILLQFRSLATADEFYAYYNGKTFSPLEPETCHIVYVRRVECEVQELHAGDIDRERRVVHAAPAALFLAPVADPQMEELPTCPVCLERLDSAVSGLLTTLCQHMFHCRCLAQWGDGNCPVCRYSQSAALVDREKFQNIVADMAQQAQTAEQWVPESTAPEEPPVASTSFADTGQLDTAGEQSSCHVCARTNDLWICLICGTIGCGRYANAHAKDHFEQTQHPYSMELDSQNVWDYVGDGYVHRLLQNAADRKVIALDVDRRSIGDPATDVGASRSAVVDSARVDAFEDALAAGTVKGVQPVSSNMQRPGSLFDAREKLDAVTQEYEMLLVSQLESQRDHYEIQLARMHHQQAQQTQHFTDMERRLNAATSKCNELEQKRAQYDGKRQSELEQRLREAEAERKEWAAERKRLETTASKWLKKSTEDARLLLEERALSQQLSVNQESLKTQIADLNASMADLQEQVRDLTFFITTQKTLGAEHNAESELHGASIVGVAEPAPPPRGRGKGKRRIPRK
ncbi:hypothetical protein IWW50_005269 [Coemansia erecta]|nr:hypothetical protein IWW50_005269 [Coemansia erecta]